MTGFQQIRNTMPANKTAGACNQYAHARLFHSRHCCRNCARKASLEVQNAHPVWFDGDPYHLRKQLSELLHPSLPLSFTKIPLCCVRILWHDALDRFNLGPATNLQNLVWPGVAINAQHNVWSFQQCLYLRCLHWCSQHDFLFVPVKPDRHHSWFTITTDV